MTTKLNAILIAVSLAAVASPVMATESNQGGAQTSRAHASAHVRHHVYARGRVNEVPFQVAPVRQPEVEDCVHVTFPQCGGDSEQSVR